LIAKKLYGFRIYQGKVGFTYVHLNLNGVEPY